MPRALPAFRTGRIALSFALFNILVLPFVVIDPQLSGRTNDVVAASVSQADFRCSIFWLSMSRIAGTLLAQALLLLAAIFVAFVAGII